MCRLWQHERGLLFLVFRWGLLFGAVVLVGCTPKVPVRDIGAQFLIADAVWFQEEETLFFFYQLEAIQGLNDTSRIEIAFETDEIEIPFTPLEDFTAVHQHLPVDCEWNARCGSRSIHVPRAPRNVRMRLRYHEDGETFLESPLAYFQINSGPDHRQRSALLYGVFDEENRRIQWRLRHQFPGLRNEEAEALGLRREFRIHSLTYGQLDQDGQPLTNDMRDEVPDGRPAFFDENPYGYGWLNGCPSAFVPMAIRELSTSARAVFQNETLPLEASSAPYACATGEVFDPTGWHANSVWAQKNPEVEPAFSQLRTPVQPLREIRYFFQSCLADEFSGHADMQRQRLLMGPEHTFCIDDVSGDALSERFRQELSSRIERERSAGEDLVLYLGLHRGPRSDRIAFSLEAALGEIFAVELSRSTPRLAGAFVFDSEPFFQSDANVRATTLWCPSFPDPLLDGVLGSSTTCAQTLIELPDITIRDISFASLPILPSRSTYESYAEKYGTEYLGSVKSIGARAPKRIAESENVPVGSFATATYFHDERIAAGTAARFSYCATEDSLNWNLVFRSDADRETRTLDTIAEWHEQNLEAGYDLGLMWDSSFYLELQYGTFAVIQPEGQEVSLLDEEIELNVTVPLGPEIPGALYPFGEQWTQSTFDLRDTLLRCNRFCDHPTFDAIGIYQIRQRFSSTYGMSCYQPEFPAFWEGGFPRDP